MKTNVYSIIDSAYGRIQGVVVAPNSSLAIRDVAPMLKRVAPHFEEDMYIECIGYYDDDLNFHATSPEVYPWLADNPEMPMKTLTGEEAVI
ncbi:hypothetical protein [Tortoise microvirus 103]|nr:hypothetical protein [Tortoise microvirus 5]QCS37447.1 hypothetical protein [Tortoise microvirus 103]